MMLRKTVLIALLSAFIFACEDSNAPKSIEEFGTIVENPVDFETCGWLINIGGEYVMPSYLPNQYEIADLEVRFTYVALDRSTTCDNSNAEVAMIRLEQIRPN